jgi:hypothetical protein
MLSSVMSGHFAVQSSCPLYPRKRTSACAACEKIRAALQRGWGSLNEVWRRAPDLTGADAAGNNTSALSATWVILSGGKI